MVIMDNASPSVPWRRNLSALWAVQFASALGFTFTFPFFTLFFQDLGIDDQARAALWGGISGWALGLGLGVFGPIWGVIGDHYGRRINLVRALFLGGVIMVLSAYAQNEYQLVFSRFVTGLHDTGVCRFHHTATQPSLRAWHYPVRALSGYHWRPSFWRHHL
jgi:MFS family permease